MKTNTIFSYVKQHMPIIILFIFIAIIFMLVFFLYRIPTEPIAYASVLSFVVIIIFFIYNYWKFSKRHAILEDLKDRITIAIDELPYTGQIIEQDYQTLITTLYENSSDIISRGDIRYTHMTEYYTMWVHQIKTPISAIRLLIQQNEISIKEDIYIELIKIEQYVDMVLQYLRVESMSSDIKLQWVELASLIKQALRKLSKMFVLRKISLNFSEYACKILTDEKWTVFVLEQVLSNALKYTREGTISIKMDSNGGKTIIIEDTGIGIQEEDIPRIFEKGFTGYNGRMDKKSTGIGLYLCKEVFKKLNHKIYITSNVGVGTRVYLDFTTADAVTD